MAPRLKSALAICAIAVPLFIASAVGLDRSPVTLHADESYAAAAARSFTGRGTDVEGRSFPLYFHAHDNVWLQPILVYVTALWLKIAPYSQASIRMPSVFIGLIDVVLMYCLAKQLFDRELPAVLASAVLGLAPAHFIHSRLALDSLYPVPFVLLWMLFVVGFMKRGTRWLLFGGTLSLGIGVYSHPASVLMMPVYLLLTCVALRRTAQEPLATTAIGALGFALPLVPLAVWLTTHPGAYLDTVGVYGIHPAHLRDPIGGLRAFLNWNTLTTRVTTYWEFFDPMFLFVRDPGTLVHSTQRAGVLLLPAAVFLPVGIHALVTSANRRHALILLSGFLSAPLAASMVDERYAIARAMALVPFAALIATYGARAMLSSSQKSWRACAVCLLILGPIQFGVFLGDYFTGYRERSSVAFTASILPED